MHRMDKTCKTVYLLITKQPLIIRLFNNHNRLCNKFLQFYELRIKLRI